MSMHRFLLRESPTPLFASNDPLFLFPPHTTLSLSPFSTTITLLTFLLYTVAQTHKPSAYSTRTALT